MLKIVRNDITKMNTEAIVNTANDHATVGSGCDTAVYKAAGVDELLNYRREKIGFVKEGDVFITPGFNLPAKYIIHAVSPHFTDEDETEKLVRGCYRKSLELAKENNIKSIAFPLIATGSFGFPKEAGLRAALDEINKFLLKEDMEVYIVVFDPESTTLSAKISARLEEYIDENYVEEKTDEEYSDRFLGNAAYSIRRKEPAGDFAESDIRERHFEGSAGRGFRMDSILPMGEMSAKPLKKEHGHKLGRKAKESEPFYAGEILADVCEEEPCEEATQAPKKGAAEFTVDKKINPLVDGYGLTPEGIEALRKRLEHLSDTFSEYLFFLMEEKGMKAPEVYNGACVDKKTFSKIKNNKNYHPKKLTALCLCIGAKLNMDQSKDLLQKAGFAFSNSDMTDIIFSFFIENEIYDIFQIAVELEERGLQVLIPED
ncbi:MAG: macro domain-containing protein [Lachnospiraceae bacterium]|nr:macro domain-containing protein [Lachnospiraceae bacterium]